MTNSPYAIYQGLPSARLLSDPYRLPVEQVVSAHYGSTWRVQTFRDMDEFASHPSAILSDGARAVFVKLSEAAHAVDQIEVELAGLRYLSARAGVLTPPPIGLVPVNGGQIMVLEAVQAVDRGAPQWREIGRTLARIHQVKGAGWGLDRQGYFGPLYQDNRPAADWCAFYIERRLWPRFMGAIDAGYLPTAVIRQVERFIARLPGLGLPAAAPTLLHGDAQQNNFISTPTGAMVIDPAIYYGHPEIDLAYVDYFQAVPDDVFLGYQEILPIEPDFSERRELWRISAYLAALQVGWLSQLSKLTGALQQYL